MRARTERGTEGKKAHCPGAPSRRQSHRSRSGTAVQCQDVCQHGTPSQYTEKGLAELQIARNTIQKASGFLALGGDDGLAKLPPCPSTSTAVEASRLCGGEASRECSLAIEAGESSGAAEVIAGRAGWRQQWQKAQRRERPSERSSSPDESTGDARTSERQAERFEIADHDGRPWQLLSILRVARARE